MSNPSPSLAEFSRDLESQDMMLMSMIEGGMVVPQPSESSKQQRSKQGIISMQEVEDNYLGSPDNWIDKKLMHHAKTINHRNDERNGL